jgi:CRISPR/Cas system CSM-associated protein Csm5 (group 7 of RAMP superfamily)
MNNKNIKEIKPIPISNIKFFVFKQKPKLKLTSSPKTNQQNISPTKNNHYQSIFASFIPKNCNIRSRAKIEKEVKYMKEPFYPRNASLSSNSLLI